MIKLGFSFHIGNKEDLDAFFKMALDDKLERTKSALYAAAVWIENNWKGWASGNNGLPGIRDVPKPSEKLVASIKRTPEESGAWEYTISSDNPTMADYQHGKDETIDMKAPNSPWLNGKRSRVNKKDGSPYLIVPFAWGTRGKTGGSAHFRNIVPAGIQRALRSREISKRLDVRKDGSKATHFEPNARGEQIERSEYDWGGRISQEEAEASGDTRAAGMVRMWDSAYKRTTGTYLTFRVISIKSAADKWIQHRKVDPIDIEGALKTEFERYITQVVHDAFQQDMAGV